MVRQKCSGIRRSYLDIHTKDSYGNSFLFIPFEGYVYDALLRLVATLIIKI